MKHKNRRIKTYKKPRFPLTALFYKGFTVINTLHPSECRGFVLWSFVNLCCVAKMGENDDVGEGRPCTHKSLLQPREKRDSSRAFFGKQKGFWQRFGPSQSTMQILCFLYGPFASFSTFIYQYIGRNTHKYTHTVLSS